VLGNVEFEKLLPVGRPRDRALANAGQRGRAAAAPKFGVVDAVAQHDEQADKELARDRDPGLRAPAAMAQRAVELTGKRLELLKEAVPSLKSVVILTDPANPTSAVGVKEAQIVARACRHGSTTHIRPAS
jgi:hypothetical protein